MNSLITSFLFLCQLVDFHAYVELDSHKSRLENPYDNGYPEERYHEVLDTFLNLYQQKASQRGQSFHIQRDWSDGAVNAWAWKWGSELWIEVPGGMSRYHLINEEGFIATLCHEAGHLFGGFPHRNEISYEGQADYYSTMKCMSEVFSALNYTNSFKNCFQNFCQQRLKGALSLSSYYASLAKVPFPSVTTPDNSRVRTTITNHPKPQCRFDTMYAGIQCDSKTPFSYDNHLLGSCQSDVAKRPACWFNLKE